VTESTICPTPSFVDEFCSALVLWRRATAPCCGALVTQVQAQAQAQALALALSRIRDASTLTSNNSATSPFIKILKSAIFSQRRNWLYAQFLVFCWWVLWCFSAMATCYRVVLWRLSRCKLLAEFAMSQLWHQITLQPAHLSKFWRVHSFRSHGVDRMPNP
jgi:hypothetical protein